MACAVFVEAVPWSAWRNHHQVTVWCREQCTAAVVHVLLFKALLKALLKALQVLYTQVLLLMLA
jgi:hypothetical protein